jgi:hypothetical protein
MTVSRVDYGSEAMEFLTALHDSPLPAPMGTLDGNSYYAGGSTLVVRKAVIDHASSGDNTIVAAVPGFKIRVLSLFLLSAGTVNVRFESGASGTALTGQMNLVANTGFALGYNPFGWFDDTAPGTLLNLELSGAVSVDGALTYALVPA